jgi:hypothetical protein
VVKINCFPHNRSCQCEPDASLLHPLNQRAIWLRRNDHRACRSIRQKWIIMRFRQRGDCSNGEGVIPERPNFRAYPVFPNVLCPYHLLQNERHHMVP